MVLPYRDLHGNGMRMLPQNGLSFDDEVVWRYAPAPLVTTPSEIRSYRIRAQLVRFVRNSHSV
jgi:hypothetical protein